MQVPKQKNQNFNYYHCEFRSEKLTGDKTKDENYLLEATESKKQILRREIENSKNSFLSVFFQRNQNAKLNLVLLKLLKPQSNQMIKAFYYQYQTWHANHFGKNVAICKI